MQHFINNNNNNDIFCNNFIVKILLTIMNKITGVVIIKLLLVEDNVHLEYTLICDAKNMCFC